MTLTFYFYAVSCFIESISSTPDKISFFQLEEFLPDITVLEDKAISHSLSEFSFSKNAFVFDDPTFQNDTMFADDESNADNDGLEMNLDVGGDAPEDFFVGADAVGDDYEGRGDYGGDNNSNGSAGPVDDGGGDGRPGPYVAFDPRQAPNGRDLILAMAETDGNSLEYFDQNFLKNWAGPEHWKLAKKVIRRSKPVYPFETKLLASFILIQPMQRLLPPRPRKRARKKKQSESIS